MISPNVIKFYLTLSLEELHKEKDKVKNELDSIQLPLFSNSPGKLPSKDDLIRSKKYQSLEEQYHCLLDLIYFWPLSEEKLHEVIQNLEIDLKEDDKLLTAPLNGGYGSQHDMKYRNMLNQKLELSRAVYNHRKNTRATELT